MPWYLGGKGDFDDFYAAMPWGVPVEGAVTYALVQIGYHLGDTLETILSEKYNDFYEMLLHHLCALFLLVVMLISNCLGIGCVIVYAHDISDIPGKIVKIFSCMRSDVLTLTSF